MIVKQRKSLLSLQERLDVYRKVMDKIIDDSKPLCAYPLFWNEMLKIGYRWQYEDVEFDFPEFFKQKPFFRSTDKNWWSVTKRGRRKRIKALKRAIKLTIKKLNSPKLLPI